MVNYGNGKIYKIERISDNVLIYVGSTTKEYLSQRLVEHKRKAKRCPNRRIYKSISDNEGWENHQILLIKQYPCNSRDELRSEEAKFIRVLKPISNIEIPMRTMKEYYIDNCEKIKLRVNNFRKENPEIMKERKRLERIKNIDKYKAREQKIITCCCGITYTQIHRTRHEQSNKHINSIPVQFKLIEEMHKHRKQYIFPVLPTL